jgi:hypothetical protein
MPDSDRMLQVIANLTADETKSTQSAILQRSFSERSIVVKSVQKVDDNRPRDLRTLVGF